MADSCGAPVDGADALMMRKKKYDRGKICVKCKERTGALVVRHAVYCKECFFPLTTFKFRRALEPSINLIPDGPRKKALKPAGNLALAFSGGLSSAVLLDLVDRSYFAPQADEDGEMKGGRDHPRNDPTRVWKRTVVVYVEVAGAHGGVPEQISQVAEIVASHPHFEFIPVRIQDAFDPAWCKTMLGSDADLELHTLLSDDDLLLHTPPASADSPLSCLRHHLTSLPSPTAVQTRIEDLVRLLLHYAARHAGASHLLLGTSLTALSVSLISSIATGGGFAVSDALHEEWAPASTSTRATVEGWDGTLRVLRPLREVSAKELAFWAHAANLRVLARAPPPAAVRASVGGLTRAFVTGLDRDFPSTVSTIARTCAKLAPRGDAGARCVLCERRAQARVGEWKARTAIREGPGGATDDRRAPSSAGRRTLAPHLCYACHTALTSRSARHTAGASVEEIPLPVWTIVSLALRDQARETDSEVVPEEAVLKDVGEEVWGRRKVEQEEMKDRIGEFLLED